jgi:hypothetical protein
LTEKTDHQLVAGNLDLELCVGHDMCLTLSAGS